ncbi:uncharacterized protein LOC142570693 [Dermacentor variabilis]|uniref:uncharacterized protein LOC142570693 n=1 Tax=Dermacentor variabilis TaxID=34621 RepID=UPI003F5BC37A
MAVADSQYLFRLIDVGAAGRFSDGGIFKNSPIGKRLHEGKLNLPRAAKLPGSERVCPHVFVDDEAFQMLPDFIRPLPGTRTEAEAIIFNYSGGKARNCTNAANSVRKQFIEYFKDEGQVSWQWDLPGVTSL